MVIMAKQFNFGFVRPQDMSPKMKMNEASSGIWKLHPRMKPDLCKSTIPLPDILADFFRLFHDVTLKERQRVSVALQLPEGLQMFACVIADIIESLVPNTPEEVDSCQLPQIHSKSHHPTRTAEEVVPNTPCPRPVPCCPIAHPKLTLGSRTLTFKACCAWPVLISSLRARISPVEKTGYMLGKISSAHID
ncbi:hypothetical protein NFI96_024112 [Prochilodus magdalenae]|nr:hypothetical protein NFI96_024112 [Prochilodus magdalenae]